ncbi:MAG: aldose epimerase family protein [Saprospiraceae bacterium]
MVQHRHFGFAPDGRVVTEYTISNRTGMEMKVIDYGCTITSLKVPDRYGTYEDVVLGFKSMQGYLDSKHYYGCIVGRVANRIANGVFSLDQREYILERNLYPHHLHGGKNGFDKVIWRAEAVQNDMGAGINFYYLSPDGDEGYPGNVNINVQYFLTQENTIQFKYRATTDQKTIINLTQHSYFNLGENNDILNHELYINADKILLLDKTMIPSGELINVRSSPFDFLSSKRIGRAMDSDHELLRIGHGYDQYWVLNNKGNKLSDAARLYDPKSGRVLRVVTSEPGIQLYTGNYLDDLISGKNGASYHPHSGVCLETQQYPDSPNHPEFPSIVLRPDEVYESTTIWKFSAEG